MLFSNANIDSPVKLDLKLIEADQVATPSAKRPQDADTDGIVFDSFGNPRQYHVLKSHPGGNRPTVSLDYEPVPADSMIHWFRADRPGHSWHVCLRRVCTGWDHQGLRSAAVKCAERSPTDALSRK